MAVVNLHNAMVPLILVAGGITLIWGVVALVPLASAARGGAVMRGFRVMLTVTAVLGLIQAVLGGLLVLQGARPHDPLHFVYGAIVLLAIPVAYIYSDQAQVRRDIIIMTIAAVAVIGAAIRALMTGA